jgi:hypothetical protein
LLQKMKDQFGVSNIELKWFDWSYISDREQVCFVNGMTSTPKEIHIRAIIVFTLH